MKTFQEYLSESKDRVTSAASEIHNALLHGAISKATSIPNFINKVLADNKLTDKDKEKVINKVKDMGYTGSLLD